MVKVCVHMFVSVFVKGIQYMQVQFPGQKLSIMHKNDHRKGNKMSQTSGTSYGINPFGKACSPYTSTTNTIASGCNATLHYSEHICKPAIVC